MIVLELKNDEEYELYDEVCVMSNLFKTMFYGENIDLTRGESKQSEKFDLKWCDKDTMEKYEEICKGVIYAKPMKELYNILDYDDVNIIFKVLNLANFFDNEKIIKLIDDKITQEITEMSFAKIKEKFDLTEEDLSEETKNQIEVLRKVSVFIDSDSEYNDNDLD